MQINYYTACKYQSSQATGIDCKTNHFIDYCVHQSSSHGNSTW